MATKQKFNPSTIMYNNKRLSFAAETTADDNNSSLSAASTTTDFEMMLDTLPTTSALSTSTNSSINVDKFVGQKKTVRYIKEKEYAVNACENGIPVIFRITELVEKPEAIEMHESLIASLDRKMIHDKRKIVCRLCKLSWTSKSTEVVRKHIIDNHMKLVKCEFCNLHFETIQLLAIHRLSHRIMCFGCKKKFSIQTELDMHLKSSTMCAKYHKINGKIKNKMLFYSKNK